MEFLDFFLSCRNVYLMTLAGESLRMHGKAITAHCLPMVKQVQGNLTPWLDMDKIKVKVW